MRDSLGVIIVLKGTSETPYDWPVSLCSVGRSGLERADGRVWLRRRKLLEALDTLDSSGSSVGKIVNDERSLKYFVVQTQYRLYRLESLLDYIVLIFIY